MGTPCRIDINAGARYMVLQVQPPAAGPTDPQPLLTYNSKNMTTAGPFGNGWNDAYRRSVSNVDANSANVMTGTGVIYAYTGLESSF